MSAARERLATILRNAAPQVIRSLAEEAARSATVTGASASTTVDEYETCIWRFAPAALDALAADDARRRALLAMLPDMRPAMPSRPIPPLARVGLMSIGLRLARERVIHESAGDVDAVALMRELDEFSSALKVLAPIAARA